VAGIDYLPEHFNLPPYNVRIIDDRELWNTKLFAYGTTGFGNVVYKQCYLPDTKGKNEPIYLFPIDYCENSKPVAGVGLRYDWSSRKPVWYRWGCEHEMVGMPTNHPCLSRAVCRKCGFREEIDSSG